VKAHLTEEVFTKNIKRIENIYSVLIKGETNPQKEVEMRVELIDALSSLEASLYSEKEANQEFIALLIKLRETLLNWDPYGQWFRHQKDLVDMVYEVIVKAKNVIFTRSSDSAEEASRLKTELSALKSELNELRSLMSSLLQQTKAPEKGQQVITETPSQKQASSPPPSSQQPRVAQNDAIVPEEATAQLPSEQAEPPVILPLEIEQSATIKDKPSEAKTPEPPTKEIPEEQDTIVSAQTLEKLSKEKAPEEQPSTILGKMKSLLSKAEEETEKQLTDFREQFSSSETPVAPPVVKEPVESKPSLQETSAASEDLEEDTIEQLAKMAPVAEQQSSPTTSPKPLDSGADPYMQLLTLEAEKYRLEKESEKNEIDFQEGLKSKQEFDETIVRINSELTAVREQIAALRKKLTS